MRDPNPIQFPYVRLLNRGMFMPHYLARAAEIVGTDRLLFSTDYPYQYRPGEDARRFLAECGLGDAETAALAHGNWLRLTGAIA